VSPEKTAAASARTSSGAGGSPKEEVEIRFGDSGNASIYTVSGGSGQGHETVYPEVAAEILGMDAEKIFLHASDPYGPTLVGDGTNFVSGATVLWNGAARPTTFVSATQVTASIAAADMTSSSIFVMLW